MDQNSASQGGSEQPKSRGDRGSNLIGGVVLIVLGLLFLANNFIPEFQFGDYWPLILVAIGAGILWKHRPGV